MPPDLVLMDTRMPGLDGIAAASQKSKTAFPDATVIIVTDYDDNQLRQAAPKAGACGVLKKHLFGVQIIDERLSEPL